MGVFTIFSKMTEKSLERMEEIDNITKMRKLSGLERLEKFEMEGIVIMHYFLPSISLKKFLSPYSCRFNLYPCLCISFNFIISKLRLTLQALAICS